MTSSRPSRSLTLLAVAALLGAAACAPTKTVKKTPASGEDELGTKLPPDASSEGVFSSSGTETEEANIRGTEFAAVGDLKTVHFEYDAYSLPEDARGILRANADYLKAHPDLEVLVEGDCDERGTVEYNLALGQKRAKAVRDYYLRIGVAGKKVATISFGKERPSCQQSTEACWAENRRAETKARGRASAAPPPPTVR